MLFMEMARAGEIDSTQGDIVVFCNTSAEHDATYEFVARLFDEAKKWGIARACLEFCPYKSKDGIRPAYRIVSPRECLRNGDVFEALLSWKGFAPTWMHRICTHFLKLKAKKLFLKDWLSGAKTSSQDALPEADYHFKPGKSTSKFINEFCADPHNHLQRVSFSELIPHSLKWIERGEITDDYEDYIGLRGDEMHRVSRGKAANEHSIYPLADRKIDKAAVFDFWGRQDFDLNLPRNEKGYARSNCTFCFLKNPRKIANIMDDYVPTSKKGTPQDIQWWKDIESKYGQMNLRRSYSDVEKMKRDQPNLPGLYDEDSLPCNCHD